MDASKPGSHGVRSSNCARCAAARSISSPASASTTPSTGKAHLRGVPTLVSFSRTDRCGPSRIICVASSPTTVPARRIRGLGIAAIASLQRNDPNALVGLPLIPALCDLPRGRRRHPVSAGTLYLILVPLGLTPPAVPAECCRHRFSNVPTRYLCRRAGQDGARLSQAACHPLPLQQITICELNEHCARCGCLRPARSVA